MTGKNDAALRSAMKKYIDTGQNSDKLTHLLHTASVDTRYTLLKQTKGQIKTSCTCLYIAVQNDVMDCIKEMLCGLTPDQQYNLLSPKCSKLNTALHIAVGENRSSLSLVSYLLNDVSQEQRYQLMKQQNKKEDTVLHCAATHMSEEKLQCLLTFVPSPQGKELFNIKNKEGKTATDIKPEIYWQHIISLIGKDVEGM